MASLCTTQGTMLDYSCRCTSMLLGSQLCRQGQWAGRLPTALPALALTAWAG